MVSASQGLSNQNTSVKKQQSISSFFTTSVAVQQQSRPAQKLTSTIPSILASAHTIDNNPAGDYDGLFIGSGDDSIDSTARRTLKRALDVNDNEFESNGEAEYEGSANLGRKRLRRSDAFDGLNEQHTATVAGTLTPTTANGTAKPKLSQRTSKYLFSSSPLRDEENVNDDIEGQRRKAKLHDRFMKKLGKPDSIADIKKRNWHITEETEENQINAEDGQDTEDEEAIPKPAAKGKIGGATKKGSSKLTPMEKQILEIKRAHLDTLLIIEVGYKFKFFGEDARIAAKELSIVCIPGKMRYDEHVCESHLNRFASASVPVHRLHVHVKRLVSAGYKVGVVRQLETAALKAVGDNRNTPFTRKLTNLYTKGTYIDDVEGIAGLGQGSGGGAPATGYLLCITENKTKGWGTDEKVHVGIVAVQPATGDVIYDDFEDGFMRSEIETRLLHIAPCEILIVGELSKATDKLVHHLSGSKSNVFGDKVRVEKTDRPKTMAAQAYSHVSNFYAEKLKVSNAVNDEKPSKRLDDILKLAENVTICLSSMITHMTDYGLEHVFDLTKYFESFSARSHMLLNGTTLSSLEIYQNQTDQTEHGSLFWTMNRTRTSFGKRRLRKWVGRPLLCRMELEERINAIEELRNGERSIGVDKIQHLLSQIKIDLEKSLIRIYYGKCARPELLLVLQTMQRIATQFANVTLPADAGFQSKILNEAVAVLPSISSDVIAFLEKINPQAAKDDDKYAFFREECEADDITEHKLGIASVEQDLDAHRTEAAAKIKKKKVDYVVVAGIEYLIEVENTNLKNVPASWAKVNGTKKMSRFHTPDVVCLIRERDQHKEALAAACDKAFISLLADIASKYQPLRDCIQALATLDCLLSLATVASQPGYVKPEYTDTTCIVVEQGRHPMVEQFLLDSYVPNDINLASDETRALLITGPNMGGKSSYVRQVALIAVMAQIGSYVPAASAKLGMLDAVFTRMGAFDNMMAGESTFMVELSETSDILKQATPKSLIILDELGRGTSTHDGVAIAQAVLDHVVRDTKSLTLFITHYQELSALAKSFRHGELKNVHMKFHETGNGGQDITFLYEVGEGVAHRSYGLNVARLANVPESVLDVAAMKSKELEEEAHERQLSHLSHLVHSICDDPDADQIAQLTTSIVQL